MEKRILVFSAMLSILALTSKGQEVHEAPAPVDPYYHDPMYYKIQDGIKSKNWNFSEWAEAKDSLTENLMDLSFIQGFITANNLKQAGDSAAETLDVKHKIVGTFDAVEKDWIAVVKADNGIIHLLDDVSRKAICYKVYMKNEHDIGTPTPKTLTDVAFAYYFTTEEGQPIAYFAETRWTDFDLNIYSYFKSFIKHGLSVKPQYSSSIDLTAAVHLNCSPNPANSNVTISYTLPYTASIELSIHNIMNTEDSKIVEVKSKTPGAYSVEASVAGFKPGIYSVQLRINSEIVFTKLICE